MKKLIILIGLISIAIGQNAEACTDIVAGKKATVDGSVITSHTYGGNDTRIRVVHGQKFPAGSMCPVYYGLQEINGALFSPTSSSPTVPPVQVAPPSIVRLNLLYCELPIILSGSV